LVLFGDGLEHFLCEGAAGGENVLAAQGVFHELAFLDLDQLSIDGLLWRSASGKEWF
jgi:hypothetical protein